MVGNSIVSPNFQIKVDTHNVTFTSPIPPTYEWQKQLENTCGITIRDIEGSGINTNTIQYRFSHNNLSHYGDWYFWSADSINISQVISVVVTLELNESPFNYIQWRAMDIAGNGFTTSPHYKVRTDITPINFSNFTPIEAVFMNASEILCSITITDNSRGSWVDASTIEYRVKLNNEDYLDWIPGSWQGIFKNITIWLEITCSEGTDNFVQFRGHDVAGNGPTISREYRISVDMTGPEFILISPDENEKHSNTDLTVSIQFTDVQTNINISSVYYRYGRKDYFITDWTSMRIHLEEEKYIGNVMITFEKGRDNIIQFKASDIVGNEALSVLFSIWINSFPKAFISSPVQNETYNDLEKVILYANGTEDPDNDVLNYTWLLEGYSVPIAYGKEASVRLHVGIQNISLIVRDDFGEEDRAEVTITVVHGPQKIKDQDNLIVIFLLIMMICIILSLVLLFYSHKHS